MEQSKGKHIFPIRPTKLVRQLLGKGALFSPGPFARFVKAGLSFTAIEDALVPLRIVATRFDDGAEHVFEAGPVMDAVLASTALPLIYPAHDVAGTLYLDGGLSNNVPLQPALAAGADTIYVLSVGFPCPPPKIKGSSRLILMHSLGILLSQRIRADEEHLPVHYPGVRIVQVPPVCTQAGLRDLSRSALLAALPLQMCHETNSPRRKELRCAFMPLDAAGERKTMKAIWNGKVVAESDDTVVVEGFHYFPIDSVDEQVLVESSTRTICPWKGLASYYTVEVDGERAEDGAFYYPKPSFLARKVKSRIAFWKGVRVEA